MPGLAIFGITGRMGQSLLRVLKESPVFTLSGAVASATSARRGLDAAIEGVPTGVPVTADSIEALKGASVAVDFSAAGSVAEHARACAAAGVPILVGATGVDAAGCEVLERAARAIPVLIAPNTSLGVGVVTKLVSIAAAALGPTYDVEVFEAHHRLKQDAPSGTALALGEAVAQARDVSLRDIADFGRGGQSAPRIPGSIGFSSLRAADIVGEHTVTFATEGERVEIIHRATDRMIFARGALRAAEWLLGQPAGRYCMRDVLGL